MNKSLKKLGKSLLYILIGLFVFVNIIAAFHAYKLTYFSDTKNGQYESPLVRSGWQKTKVVLFGVDFPKRPITGAPPNPYETFWVTTEDGLKLEGWYVPKLKAKGTVIMFHGHGGNKSRALTEATAFHDLGYSVCLVDFRAHGNSQGNVCTIGYKESADVKAAYDFVAAKGETNIVLWGISLGAATITKAVHDYQDMHPSKVILEMPFASLTQAVKGRLRTMHVPVQPFAALLTFWGGVERGFWAFGLRPEDYVKSIRVPTLVQWGRHDVRVVKSETYAVYKNLAAKSKKLVIYENSGHQSLCINETEKWNNSVKEFLR